VKSNKLLVKKNRTATFLVIFERLFLQIDSLDSHTLYTRIRGNFQKDHLGHQKKKEITF